MELTTKGLSYSGQSIDMNARARVLRARVVQARVQRRKASARPV